MIPVAHLRPETRDLLRPMIEGVMARQVSEVPVPDEAMAGDGWRLIGGDGEHRGQAIIFTLGWMESRQFHSALWIGVAGRSRSGGSLWRTMHDPPHPLPTSPRTDASRQPKTPWLATRILPGILGLTRDQIIWTADFAECLAWTWLLDFSDLAKK